MRSKHICQHHFSLILRKNKGLKWEWSIQRNAHIVCKDPATALYVNKTKFSLHFHSIRHRMYKPHSHMNVTIIAHTIKRDRFQKQRYNRYYASLRKKNIFLI